MRRARLRPVDPDVRTTPERYGSAAVAGNLRPASDHPTDLDTIAAAGAAALSERLGVMLLRLRCANDRHAWHEALAEFRQRAVRLAVRKRWRAISRHQVKALAELVLRWWCFDVCPACKGRRFKLLPNVPNFLSDEPCPSCYGEGHSPIERAVPVERIGRAKDLAEILARAAAGAEDVMGAQLSGRASRPRVTRGEPEGMMRANASQNTAKTRGP